VHDPRRGRHGVGLLLLLALGFAATPVTLPPGEPAADWAEALALAGLTQGGAGTVGVVVLDEGATWRIRVRDASGQTREAVVPRPTTAGAREDVAWLMSSLVDSVSVRRTEPPPAPAAPAPRPVPAPAPVPVPAAPVAAVSTPAPPVEPATPVPAPVPVPEPTPAPIVEPTPVVTAPATPPARAPDVSLSLGVSSAVALKPGVAPGAALGFDLGVVPIPALYLGLGVHGGLPATLTQLPGERRLSDVSLLGEIGWHPSAGVVSPTLDLAGGVAWRQFADNGQLVALAPFPTVEIAGGVALPVRSWLALEPSLAVGAYLRTTDLVVEGGAPERMSPWAARLGVRLRSTFPVSSR